jgi:hypothetical protein
MAITELQPTVTGAGSLLSNTSDHTHKPFLRRSELCGELSLQASSEAILTCGLRISDNPTSDHLTPQEITNQDTPDMGADGGDLSCPGSSVVADTQQEFPDSFTVDEER